MIQSGELWSHAPNSTIPHTYHGKRKLAIIIRTGARMGSDTAPSCSPRVAGIEDLRCTPQG
ncbi:hypothetical protein I7I48_11502 [Histoplasma ohiense]|nr:hypothetical protein I7I48_11502 [Histoplasma ohiense (nom. inval.)]